MLSWVDLNRNTNYSLGRYQQSISLLFIPLCSASLKKKKKSHRSSLTSTLYLIVHMKTHIQAFFMMYYLLGKVRISWFWSGFLSSLSQKILNNFIHCGRTQIIDLREVLFTCATLTWKVSSWFSCWNIFVLERLYIALQFMNYCTVSMDTSFLNTGTSSIIKVKVEILQQHHN